MSGPKVEGGERSGVREAIGRHTEQLVKAGNSPAYAAQKAREAAIRHDQRNGTTPNPNRKK